MDKIYNYLIHYNAYTETWNAFLREECAQYFNDKSNTPSLITSNTIHELLIQLHDINHSQHEK